LVDDLSRLADDELLARAKDEDWEAFRVFFERHHDAISGFLGAATRDTQLTLDLTMEVFGAALVAVKRYRPGEAPAQAWLFGIARNKLAKARRRRRLDRSATRKLGIERLEYTDAAIEQAEREIDSARGAYLAALDKLSPPERDAIVAHVIEQRDYPDIAATSGVTEAAIRQRVSRGLAKLARIVRQE
jgi:RNA polymerase sigma factor (sigma-70 family)